MLADLLLKCYMVKVVRENFGEEMKSGAVVDKTGILRTKI